MNSEDFYITKFIYNGQNSYCIWYYPSDSSKDFFMASDNEIIRFDNVDSLISFAENNKMNLYEIDEPSTTDVDRLEFLKSNIDANLDCNEVLNFWNTADALCNTMKISFLGKKKKYDFVYNELFGGCNTAANLYEYHPVWSSQDLKLIKEVLQTCYKLILEFII